MKLIKFAILFSILIISLWVVTDVKVNNLIVMTQSKIEYNKLIDSAVDDGIAGLVELDNHKNIVLNKDKAIEQFYASLYSNFNVLGFRKKEEKLMTYIPIIVILYTDGYYINYSDYNENEEGKFLVKKWTSKLPYAFEDEELIYKFTLGSFLSIYDKRTKKIHEGEYSDLSAVFPSSILKDWESFDYTRRSTIVCELEDTIKYYINNHNSIGQQFGIEYNFYLPRIEKSQWYRTVDDISMLVLFQGYPFGIFGVDRYNRYSFAGARIKKSQSYYLQYDQSESQLFYHKSTCDKLANKKSSYYTKEECAREGGFPCLKCRP